MIQWAFLWQVFLYTHICHVLSSLHAKFCTILINYKGAFEKDKIH
jgi:hypothetical protein